MYKVNASLESLPLEIGRARAFPRGWLENESIWLHMEYKYMLEALRAELYEEFFADFRTALVPFLDPATYGRSTLENSSFIASSAHADPTLHGAGFVARLTGSTAEFLSIWKLLFVGELPFSVVDGNLCLTFRPRLPAWLFSESSEVSFRFLGSCDVTYHNPQRLDTYAPDARITRILVRPMSGDEVLLQNERIPAPFAEMARSGRIRSLDLWF